MTLYSLFHSSLFFSCFFFNDTATTEIYTLSLHDALPLLSNGFRLGLTSGYVYGDKIDTVLDNAEYQEQIVDVPVGELNFVNLMDFRIDGFLEDPFVAASINQRSEERRVGEETGTSRAD